MKTKYTETQIISILKEYDAGISGRELARKYQVSRHTIYDWKKKYSGMGLAELRRVKELEEENKKLKQMYANLSLENHALKDLIEKKR